MPSHRNYLTILLYIGASLLGVFVLLGSYCLYMFEYGSGAGQIVQQQEVKQGGLSVGDIRAQLEALKNQDPNYVPPTPEEIDAQLTALKPSGSEGTTNTPEEIKAQLNALRKQ